VQVLIQEVLIAFLATFSLSAVLTPIFGKIAMSLGIVDRPNQAHKTHIQPIPYLGGLSIVSTFLIGLSVAYSLRSNYLSNPRELLILIAAPLLLAIVGLIDDIRNLGALPRLFVQSISAAVVSLLFIDFGWFGEPTDSQILSSLVTVVWIVGITNALNFIDNLDGGAGGVVVICSITLAFASIAGDQLAVSALAVALAGATLGFLVWNLYPARIYLGDSGALFLGSILAVLTIRFDPPTADPFSAWLFAFLLFAVPILDTSVAVISRLHRRVSPFQGGRDHLSHRLLNIGLTKKLTALSIWFLQIYFSSLALILLAANSQESLIVELLAAASWSALFVYFLKVGSVSAKNHDYHKNQSPKNS